MKMTKDERNKKQKGWQATHRKKMGKDYTDKQDAKKFEKYYTTLGGRASHMLNNARARAKRLGVRCSLTKEWFEDKLSVGKCEVTDIPFVIVINGGRGHSNNSFSPSTDRIDQTGEYTPENCRVVVWIYNRARGAFPDKDFDTLLKAMQNKDDSGFVVTVEAIA